MSRHLNPGICVAERAGSLDFQARMLFQDYHSPAARYFMQVNADTPWLKPGQIMIVANPDSPDMLRLLPALRQLKHTTNTGFTGVSVPEASFLQKHYGIIAGLASAGDRIFGTVSDAGEKYFKRIEFAMRNIETSYQNQYRAHGKLSGEAFFTERRRLLNELGELVNKPLLKSLTRFAVKLNPYDDMRRALRLSSRAIVHEWSAAGVAGIPGYANFTARAATAARFLKRGGYIGIGFAFAGVTNDVAHACMTGREPECGKFAFKEYAKFSLSTLAAMGAGSYGAATTIGACAAIGIATVGVGGVACAAVGSVAGGYIGSQAAELGVDMIYKQYGQRYGH